MAIELAQGYVSLTPSAKGIASKIREEMGGPVEAEAARSGDAAGKSFVSKFTGSFGGLGGQIAAVAGIGAVTGFIGSTIKAASDMNETMTKLGKVFEGNTAEVTAWAKNAATEFGMSRQQALEAAGTFGNLFTAMGVAKPATTEMSKSLVGLAGDLASFNNANPEETLLALRSGVVGETEPLRRFGVNLNEARIQAEAMRLGLVSASVDQTKLSQSQESVDKATRKVAETMKKYGKDSTQYADALRDQQQATDKLSEVTAGKFPKALDAATKAQAAYSLIMHDTALAQGDFKNTGDGLANQGKSLAAMWANLKEDLGNGFLPVATAAAHLLSGTIVPAFTDMANRVAPAVQQVTAVLGGMFAAMRSGKADEGATGIAAAFQSIGVVLHNVQGAVRTFFTAFQKGGSEADTGGFLGKVVALGSTVGRIFNELRAGVSELIGKLSEVDWGKAFSQAQSIVAPIASGILDVANAVAKIIEKGLPTVIDLFGKLFDVGQKIAPVVGTIAQVLGTVLGGTLQVLAPVLSEIGGHMDQLLPAIIAGAAAWATWKGVSAVTSTVKGVGDTISAVSSIADTFGVSFGRAAGEALKQTGPIEAVTGKFNSLKTAAISALDSLKGGAARIGSGLSSAFDAIKSAAITAATSLKSAAVAAYEWIAAQVAAAVAAARAAAAWVAQKVVMVATTVATNAMAAAQWLLNAAMNANPIGLIVVALTALVAGLVYAYTHSERFRNIVNAIGSAIMGALKAAIDWLTNTAIPAVVGFVSAAGDKISEVIDFFTALPGRILNAIGDAAAWLIDKGRDVIVGLFNGIVEAHATMIDWVTGIAGRVINAIGNATLWLIDKGGDIMRGLLRGIVDTFEGQVRGALNIGSKVLEAVGNLGSLLYNTGIDVVQGLVDGVRAAFGRMWSAAADLVSGFKDRVTGLFHIGSPSRVMRDIGLDVMAGMQIGIEEGSKDVVGALNKVTDFTTPKIGGAGFGVNAAVPAVAAFSAPAAGSPISVNVETDANPYRIADAIAWEMRLAGR